MSRGRLPVVLICTGAALVVVVGLYLTGWSHPPATQPATSTDAPVASSSTSRLGSPALTQAQADVIGATLASGDTARVAALLADGVRAEYESSPSSILPPGGSLTIRAADVRVTGVGRAAGLVRSHSTAESTQWALSLVLEKGQWKVLMMVKVGPP
jgi:hypothetical protein